MKGSFKRKYAAIFMIAVMITGIFSGSVFADGGWKSDSKGWWYETGGSYYKSQWAEIDGQWYYFDSKGYMEHDCYRGGYWLKSNGAWDKAYSHGKWMSDSKGWWYEDNGWYPKNKWLQIDGARYYFGSKGYIEHDCYRDGCWLRSNGMADPQFSKGTWKSNAKGWWYEDNGWYPKNKWLWIDGARYYFDDKGYMESECYRNGCWLDAKGRWDQEFSHGKWQEKWKNGRYLRWYEDNGWYPVNKGLVIDGLFYWFDSEGYVSYEGEKPDIVNAASYNYEIIPLVSPINVYYYIKTDNPDPDSFRFIDRSSKYYTEDSDYEPLILASKTIYSDVIYENKSTARVKGGYIAYAQACNVDGGEFVMQAKKVVGVSNYIPKYEFVDTTVKVKTQALVDEVDYLIDTYGGSEDGFFSKLYAIQDGLNSISLYNGVYILGNVVTATTSQNIDGEFVEGKCYYGISTSPHKDQNFYMKSPYARLDSKPMLLNNLYSYKLDSIGFPSMMASVANRLEPTSTVTWDSYNHSQIHISYNGYSNTFGGAGTGGGQGIYEKDILYYYKFDGSSSDAYKRCSFDTLRNDIKYYGKLNVDSNPDENGLKWNDVRRTVGKGGSYVRISFSNWVITSDTEYTVSVQPGFTFLYDNGGTRDQQGFIAIGCMSNAWYDGRYFNIYEQFYPGVSFEETLEKKPKIVIKDLAVTIPAEYTWCDEPLSEVGYDVSKGVFSGFTTFYYDANTDSWKPRDFEARDFLIYDYDTRTATYLKDDPTYGPALVDALTITHDEALKMGLDKNTNKDPSSYYIYDCTAEPGTYHKAG